MARLVLRKLIVSFTVVVLLYAAQITCWSSAWNRYFAHWQFADGLAIVIGMVTLALAGAAAAIVLDVFGGARLRRAGHFLFLVAVTNGVTSTMVVNFIAYDVAGRHDWLSILCWALAVVVLLRWREPLTKIATNACLILSPLVVILGYEVLTWSSWTSNKSLAVEGDTRAPSRGATAFPRVPVFVFLFDQWSYARSVDDHGFLPSLENARRLCRQSVAFTDARSPADGTQGSLPRFIYQQYGDVIPRGGKVMWRCRGKTRPSEEVRSLFAEAQQCGYRTVLAGFYHPYADMLGDQLDQCRSYPYHTTYENIAAKTLAAAVHNLRFWTDPLSRCTWRTIYPRAFSRYWVDINRQIHTEAIGLIRTCPENTFAFFHWPLPHDPYVFNADGTFRGPFREYPWNGTPEDHMQQLHYADRVLGDLIDNLQQCGKFDRSLIIVTSDHSWHLDPDPTMRANADDDLHVPLIIKLPRQKAGLRLRNRFETVRLKPLLDAVFRGESDTETLIELVRSMAASADTGPGASGRQPVGASDPGQPGPAR